MSDVTDFATAYRGALHRCTTQDREIANLNRFVREDQERIAALEAELADTKRQLELTEGSYNSDMRNAIAEHEKLEAEVLALREFREAQKRYDAAVVDHAGVQGLDQITVWAANIELVNARAALDKAEAAFATDHGLPLPGAGEGARDFEGDNDGDSLEYR